MVGESDKVVCRVTCEGKRQHRSKSIIDEYGWVSVEQILGDYDISVANRTRRAAHREVEE